MSGVSMGLPLREGLTVFTNVYMPSCSWADRTCEEYERDVEQLVDGLIGRGRDSWHQVTLLDLQNHLSKLSRQGLEDSSCRRKVFAIKAFFDYLTAGGYIPKNPAEQLVPPEKTKQEPRFLVEAEYNAFLAQIIDPRDKH
ncbi:MAG: site-specific integrase [Anaerolineales bacterium]|nr:site-specific integrase [Anaerolineales bacterium]